VTARNGELLRMLIVVTLALIAGFAGSTALGLSWTAGKNELIAAGIAANALRLDAGDKAMAGLVLRQDSLQLESVALRSRLDRVEERAPGFAVTAHTLIEQERHLSAIDGRLNANETQSAATAAALQAQLTKICTALDGISSASARRYGCR